VCVCSRVGVRRCGGGSRRVGVCVCVCMGAVVCMGVVGV
jgi:hypothetical protein